MITRYESDDSMEEETVDASKAVAQDESYLLHRSLVEHPYVVEKADGIRLTLADGKEIIDACAGAAVAAIGHNNKEVQKAIMNQLQQVSYVHTQAYTTSSAEDLARLLLENEPFGFEKVLFVSSGSEAIDSAMKLARQHFWEKCEMDRMFFVSRKQSYHGNSIGAMSVSGNVARKAPYEGFGYPHVSQVSPAFEYHYKHEGESTKSYVNRLLQEIEDEFIRIGPEKVIAFIAEPIVGATSGCVTAPPGYFAGVRTLCNKYGILLILDEIMCGVGRSGTFFAFEQEQDVIPDIVTVAKGLGGGYAPIAGVFINRSVVRVLRKGTKAFNHGHTYQAHPVSCAAALAVQKIIRREGLIDRCANMGKILERILRDKLQGCWSVGDIRGRGLFWAIDFVQDKESKEPFDPLLRYGLQIQKAAFREGVAIYPGAGTIDGKRGDHILLAPPFTIAENELEHVCEVLCKVICTQQRSFEAGNY